MGIRASINFFLFYRENAANALLIYEKKILFKSNLIKITFFVIFIECLNFFEI